MKCLEPTTTTELAQMIHIHGLGNNGVETMGWKQSPSPNEMGEKLNHIHMQKKTDEMSES